MGHLTIEQLIQGAVGLVTGALTVGAAWGVMKAETRGLKERLDQHITTTAEWRESLDTRMQDVTTLLMGRSKRRR